MTRRVYESIIELKMNENEWVLRTSDCVCFAEVKTQILHYFCRFFSKRSHLPIGSNLFNTTDYI